MEDVVIYGAGGLGSVVVDILEHAGRYRPVAFLDSDVRKHGTEAAGLPIVGDLAAVAQILRRGVHNAIVAIGDNAARVAIAEALAACGLRLVSAIHPLASFALSSQVAEHVIVGARVNVCVHAHIGPHTVLSAGSIAEHDNVIGRGVFLEPAVRLAGGVRIDDYVTLGVGACVIPGRSIGNWARVLPGAVVIQDVPPHATVGGVPAVAHVTSRFVPEPRPPYMSRFEPPCGTAGAPADTSPLHTFTGD